MLFTMLPAVLLALAASAGPQTPTEPHDRMPELNGIVQPRIHWDASLPAGAADEVTIPAFAPRPSPAR